MCANSGKDDLGRNYVYNDFQLKRYCYHQSTWQTQKNHLELYINHFDLFWCDNDIKSTAWWILPVIKKSLKFYKQVYLFLWNSRISSSQILCRITTISTLWNSWKHITGWISEIISTWIIASIKKITCHKVWKPFSVCI